MKIRIMIVDDEDDIRSMVRDIFESDGYEVLEAADAAALRRSLSEPAPDVVLLDLNLPDAEGLSLLPELKRKWPTSKVIILTGYGTAEAADKAFRLDDVYLESKPFDVGTLKALVQLALKGAPQQKRGN